MNLNALYFFTHVYVLNQFKAEINFLIKFPLKLFFDFPLGGSVD